MANKNPNLILLGAKIRSLRESFGYSQEGFANELGFDRAYYGGIERGERNVAALNLIQIAQTLNVELEELFPPIDEFQS
ncbi:hypothetical protein MNBD_GAMMA18-489 [hydrothermal vent metagenome]|uniref:HTH cro/C1-type domain-containing protein n=1 Tax=hydrothermal vent metagenome TaxID=652676 RepID=A0A3B1A9P4_9ZZZZ